MRRTSHSGKLVFVALLCLGAGSGCVDAVREGFVNGAGSAVESSVVTALGFFTIGLDAAMNALKNALAIT